MTVSTTTNGQYTMVEGTADEVTSYLNSNIPKSAIVSMIYTGTKYAVLCHY